MTVKLLINSYDQKQIDVIGDVHGCALELDHLLSELGYESNGGAPIHPQGRIAAFSGDLVNRGPRSLQVLETVQAMQKSGSGMLAALGQHDWALYCNLVLGAVDSRDADGQGIRQLIDSSRRTRMIELVAALFVDAPAYSLFDGGDLVVANAAIEREMKGNDREGHRQDSLSLLCRGQRDPSANWAEEWVDELVIVGDNGANEQVRGPHDNVINLDAGCEYGGALSAFRYPENELVSVGSQQKYWSHNVPERYLSLSLSPLQVSRRALHSRHGERRDQQRPDDERRTPSSNTAPRAIRRQPL